MQPANQDAAHHVTVNFSGVEWEPGCACRVAAQDEAMPGADSKLGDRVIHVTGAVVVGGRLIWTIPPKMRFDLPSIAWRLNALPSRAVFTRDQEQRPTVAVHPLQRVVSVPSKHLCTPHSCPVVQSCSVFRVTYPRFSERPLPDRWCPWFAEPRRCCVCWVTGRLRRPLCLPVILKAPLSFDIEIDTGTPPVHRPQQRLELLPPLIPLPSRLEVLVEGAKGDELVVVAVIHHQIWERKQVWSEIDDFVIVRQGSDPGSVHLRRLTRRIDIAVQHCCHAHGDSPRNSA